LVWIALPIYAVFVKWPYWTLPQSLADTSTGGVLFEPLIRFLNGDQPQSIRLRLVGLLLNLLQALLINALINRHRMMGSVNQLPALAYLTISSALPAWNACTPTSLVITITLWIFQSQFSLYQSPQSRGAVYNRCLVWALLPLIEPAAWSLCLWGWICIWVMRPFRWSEFGVMLVGLLTPYYFLGVWRYWNGVDAWYRMLPPIHVQLPNIGDPRWFFAGVGLLAIPTLLGMMQVQSNLRKMLIPVRKGWTHWTLLLILTLPMPFLVDAGGWSGFGAILVPIAAFQACFFYYSSLRILPLIFFWAQLFAVLWIQYGSRFS